MIQLVIFDMAGTAIEEDNLVYKTIQSTLKDHAIDVNLPTVLGIGAGKEKRMAIRDILEELSPGQWEDPTLDTIHEAFQENLKNAYATFPLRVFPSVWEVMQNLRGRGIKVAFNTGYTRSVAESILVKTNLQIGRDLDALMTASEVENPRPAPDMITALCEVLTIKPELTIKIGDSAIDIEEGKNAGVAYTIGVTTGAQSREQIEQAQADFILDDMKELLTLIPWAEPVKD